MPLFAQVLRKKHAESAGPLVNPSGTIAQPATIDFHVQIQRVTKNSKLQLSVEAISALANL
jgi:hypothetical protein